MKIVNKQGFKVFAHPNHRTIVIMVFSIVVAAFLAGIIVLRIAYIREIAQAENNVQNIGLVIEAHTNSFMEKFDLVLQGMLGSIKELAFKKDGKQKYLKSLCQERYALIPEAKGLKILDSNGNYLCDESGLLPAANNSDREYFKQHKNNPNSGLIISKPVISKTSNTWVIVLSRRMNGPNNEFAGVVLASISVSYVSEIYSRLDMGADSSIGIYNATDHSMMVRYPLQEDKLAKPNTNAEVFKEMQRKPLLAAGLFEGVSSIDGLTKIFSYRKIPKFNVNVIVTVSKNDVLRKSWFVRAISLMVFITLGASASLYFLYHYLVSMNQLAESQMQIVKQSKMSALGEMAGGLAHEINTPLAIIQLRTDQLTEMLQDNDFDRQAALKALNAVTKTIHRISKIIRSLRTFARDGQKDEMEVHSVNKIVEDTFSLCHEKFHAQGVRLEFSCSQESELVCRSHEISQVLLNFLNNAYDAIQEKPDKWVKVDVVHENEGLRFSITDCGNGIPKDLREKIMQPFFTTKATGKGTGIGLSISKGIVEAHGGYISIDTASANTKFDIYFPEKRKAA